MHVSVCVCVWGGGGGVGVCVRVCKYVCNEKEMNIRPASSDGDRYMGR